MPISAEPASSLLLVDISNSYVKFAPADGDAPLGQVARLSTAELVAGHASELIKALAGRRVAASSVVPAATAELRALCHAADVSLDLLDASSVGGALAIDYPEPATIGADRLANALGVVHLYGAPAVVIDFGTAVTFDIVNGRGAYVGGIIAPGLAAMTDYLHERTALLPRIEVLEPDGFIGKSTVEAMRIGAVHGYRGLIRELLGGLRREMTVGGRPLHVVATGGYAGIIASHLDEIDEVHPALTLEGLRVFARFLSGRQPAD